MTPSSAPSRAPVPAADAAADPSARATADPSATDPSAADPSAVEVRDRIPARLPVPGDPKTVTRIGSWSTILVVLVVLHVLAFQATEFRPDALVTGARA